MQNELISNHRSQLRVMIDEIRHFFLTGDLQAALEESPDGTLLCFNEDTGKLVRLKLREGAAVNQKYAFRLLCDLQKIIDVKSDDEFERMFMGFRTGVLAAQYQRDRSVIGLAKVINHSKKEASDRARNNARHKLILKTEEARLIAATLVHECWHGTGRGKDRACKLASPRLLKEHGIEIGHDALREFINNAADDHGIPSDPMVLDDISRLVTALTSGNA